MGYSGGSGVQGSSIISDCSGSSAGAATSGCGGGMDTGVDRGKQRNTFTLPTIAMNSEKSRSVSAERPLFPEY